MKYLTIALFTLAMSACQYVNPVLDKASDGRAYARAFDVMLDCKLDLATRQAELDKLHAFLRAENNPAVVTLPDCDGDPATPAIRAQ